MTPEQSFQMLNLSPRVTARWIDQLREPHRHYHTVRHIESMLAWIEPEDATRELLAAIWLHDIIYDPRASDNEAQSAVQAVHDLRDSDMDAEYVANLIRGTKFHESGSDEQNLLNDLDLTILGAPRSVYQDYADRIRMEYAHVPAEIYRPNRALLLRHFDEGPIYRTTRFGEFEEQAHQNLRWEIARLEA